MKLTLHLRIERSDSQPVREFEIAAWERGAFSMDSLGLTLAESKNLLKQLQEIVVEHQCAEFVEAQRPCPDCGTRRTLKGQHRLVYRTLYGNLYLPSPRLRHCQCQPHTTHSFSPLAEALNERTSPERVFLETKFASLMSYGLSANLLAETLPMEGDVNPTSIRHHVRQVAERLDEDLGEERGIFIDGCQREWAKLPRPELPITVGIDGGYIRTRPAASSRGN